MSLYTKSLFIFRRDFRLQDNTGLIAAMKQSDKVIPCFIFDPRQVGKQNPYRSLNAIQFMIASLKSLQKQLKKRGGKLYIFYGKTPDVIKKLITQEKVDAVFCNRDYTPFSMKRDKAIASICKKADVTFESYDDALLNAPEQIKTKAGNPYAIFTPYWKSATKQSVAKMQKSSKNNFYTGTIKNSKANRLFKKILSKTNSTIAQQGGREAADNILKNLKKFKAYSKTRDFPAIATTGLSAHIKFGTVSMREVYWAMRKALGRTGPAGLMRQLYWHDFYYQVAYHWPKVFGSAFHDKYNKLKWRYNKKDFKRWCDGTTGFPIVDAGMRQLNQTGFMHNRARMIVASFLTKDLQIDWRWGEKYFAQKLVDYDPCVNNGNWQWSASTGCDAQPYFRVFNPWLQQKKYDPDCAYIKTWIDELKDVDCKIIHKWEDPKSPKLDYPRPMVNHSKEKEKAIKMFKAAAKR